MVVQYNLVSSESARHNVFYFIRNFIPLVFREVSLVSSCLSLTLDVF